MKFLYTAHITKSHGGLSILFYGITILFYGVRRTSACEGRLWQPLSVHIRSHPPTHPLNPSMNVNNRRPDHNAGNYVPYSCEQCVGSLMSHKVIMNKGCETGPTIYRPYPRRLDSLTICRCHYKGSTFSSVI